MRKESFEKTVDIPENNYQRYLELGGNINKKDYQSVIDRINNAFTLDGGDPEIRSRISQAEGMARYAGIKLNDSKDALDPSAILLDSRVVLYVILRSDVMSKGVICHHSQMTDQRLFVEALRMLGDTDSLDKMFKAYPNISFKYERGK